MPRVIASKKVSVSRTVARAASKRAIKRIRLAIATVSLIRVATLGGRCSSSARAEEGIATATPIFCQAAFRPNKLVRFWRGARGQLSLGCACFGVVWSRRCCLALQPRRRRPWLGLNVRPRVCGPDPTAASAVGPGAYAVGLGLWAVTCATPQVRAPSPCARSRRRPKKKSHRHRHTRAKLTQKLTKKITLCNNFAQLSLQSQQRCAQTRTSSPERQ